MTIVNDTKSSTRKKKLQPYTVVTDSYNSRIRYYCTTFRISKTYYLEICPPLNYHHLYYLSYIGEIGFSIIYNLLKIIGIGRICIYDNRRSRKFSIINFI